MKSLMFSVRRLSLATIFTVGFLLLIVFLQSAAAQPGGQAVRPHPRLPENPQIVGGQDADPGEWPWQVALVNAGSTDLYNNQFCGGSVIDEYWVLTAAHCTDGAAPSSIDIVAGIQNLVTPEAGYQQIGVLDIIIHPGWDPATFDYDISLLRLAEPVQFGTTAGGLDVEPAPLVPSDVGDLVDVLSAVTGWGNTIAQPVPGGSNFPAQLQEVEVPILSNAQCEALYDANDGPGDWITANMLCAGYEAGGKDSCQGDSGGPLVVYDTVEEMWWQAGVVSWGTGCAAPGLPGVYARVSQFTDWINETINSPVFDLYKDGPDFAAPGGVITYDIYLYNDGTAEATGITVTDMIPDGTEYVAGSATNGGAFSGGTVAWDNVMIAGGGVFEASFQVIVDADFPTSDINFFDDMEGDLDAWSVSHDTTYADVDWEVVDSNPYSPDYSWYAENVDVISDQYLDLSVPGALPADAVLSFWHYYDTEPTYDGGIVEISTDGGASWSNLGDEMFYNGYNGVIDSNYDNPLAGSDAFTGNSEGYIQTLVDLSAYEGENVIISFRLATDSIIGANGWYVDDVLVGSLTVVSNTAYAGELPSNIVLTAITGDAPQDMYKIYLPLVLAQ